MKPKITNNVLDGLQTLIELVPASKLVGDKHLMSAVTYITKLIEYRNSAEFAVVRAKIQAAYTSVEKQ